MPFCRACPHSIYSHISNSVSYSPQEELCVIHPLVDEMSCDGLRVVWEMHIVHGVDEQGWIVVQSSNGHLQTHGSQLTGLHTPHQTLQHCLHKQRDTL